MFSIYKDEKSFSLTGNLLGACIGYAHCTSPSTGSFEQFAGRLRNDPAWQFFDMQTGHGAMITEPQALCRILLQSV